MAQAHLSCSACSGDILSLNTPTITLILAIYSYDAVPTLCQPLNGVRGRQGGEQGFSDIAPTCTELTSVREDAEAVEE